MKNLVVIVLFLGAIICGGVWVMSDNAGDSSGDPETPDEVYVPDPVDEELELPVVSKEGPWPKLAVDTMDYNFGTMLVGQKDSHVFVLRNEGDAELELVEGKPSCKCTKFSLAKKILAPGESTELTVEWHAKLVDDSFSHGGPIYTNDPAIREMRFAVAGVVDEAVEILPSTTWHLNADDLESEASVEGFVASRVYDELKVKSIELDSPFLKATSRKATAAEIDELGTRPGVKSGVVLAVSFTPEAPPGTIHTRMDFELEGVDGQFSVQVSGKKQGPIRIIAPPGVAWNDEKSGLQLGRFPKLKGRTATLNLIVDHADFDESLAITELETDPKYVEVQLDEGVKLSGDRRRYQLSISVPAGSQPMSRSAREPGVLKIRTNHPSGYEVSILLSFIAF